MDVGEMHAIISIIITYFARFQFQLILSQKNGLVQIEKVQENMQTVIFTDGTKRTILLYVLPQQPR